MNNFLWGFGLNLPELRVEFDKSKNMVQPMNYMGATHKQLEAHQALGFSLHTQGTIYSWGSNLSFEMSPSDPKSLYPPRKVGHFQEGIIASNVYGKTMSIIDVDAVPFEQREEMERCIQYEMSTEKYPKFKPTVVRSNFMHHVTYYILGGKLVAAGRLGTSPIAPKFQGHPLHRPGPNKIVHIPLPFVVQGISCSNTHVLVWSREGKVQGWGLNNHGCIGVANNEQFNFKRIENPQPVELIKGVRVISCLALDDVSFVINYLGKAFTWGL